MSHFEVRPVPAGRAVVVDAGYLAAGRHVIHGLVEANVTVARELLRTLSPAEGGTLSFTAFIVASLGRAIADQPAVQGYLDWRGRLVVFHEVDVVTMIERERGAVAIPHIIRDAHCRSVAEISAEVRAVQAEGESNERQNRLVALAPRVPRFVRLFLFWLVKKNPHRFKQLQGTVQVTAVGMFGKGGGWGISFLPTHTLGITVGGIGRRPVLVDGRLAEREFLHLTISFDHDIVDGAPAARFAKRFLALIEEATVLLEMAERIEPAGAG